MSDANCCTLFGLGGRFPRFRLDKISSAVFGSISMTTLVSGGFCKCFSISKLAGIYVAPMVSIFSERTDARDVRPLYQKMTHDHEVFLYAATRCPQPAATGRVV